MVPAAVPDKVTKTLFANWPAMVAPSTSEIITAGIIIVLSAPPITIGAPGTLFTIITATAPASCAFLTLITKVQLPLLINAILPAKAPPLEGTTQASCVAAALSL